MEAPPVPDLPAQPHSNLHGDPIWNAALDWLLQSRENPQDPALQQALTTWLAADPAHERAYRKAERVWRLSGELSFATPAVETPTTTPSRPHVRRRWQRSLTAGALAASVALLTLPDWLALSADEASGRGEHRSLVLEDGSRIELDSSSAIDVQFSATGREVTLRRGQAFFEVSHDPSRPFRVLAGDVQVTVTGTAFEVGLASRQVAVAVESGKVLVDSGHAGESTTPLGAGDRLRIPTDASSQHDRVPVEQVAAWRNWQLLVNDRPLADVVDELRRYQPGLILLNDDTLSQRRVTAALDLRNPKSALQAALAPLGGHLDSWSPLVLVIAVD